MPPVSLRSLGASFRPDYSIFFLCDTFFVDGLTIERVKAVPGFAEHASLFDALQDTGRLKIVDYRAIVRPYDELIDGSALRDISDLASWTAPFLELREQWRAFDALIKKVWDPDRRERGGSQDGTLRSEVLAMAREFDPMVPGILDDWLENSLVHWKGAQSRADRERTRSTLFPCLAHVSATLCLSDYLGAIIHDWADMAPLYRHKLSMSVAVNAMREQKEQEVCRQLLALMFPDFRPKSTAALAKLLEDRRTERIRELVRRCVEDGQPFDVSFANSLFRDLLAREETLARYRNIIGWLTTPLSFVPWVGTALEKGVQSAVDRQLTEKIRGNKSWFFLLSGINDSREALRLME